MAEIDPQYSVLMIRLTNSYPEPDDDSAAFRAALYDSTSKWWKISAGRTVPGPGAPEYAFAVHKGIVRAVYAIGGWRRSPDETRLGFSGTESAELGDQYIGTDVSEYFPKGAANPLRFVNCDAVPYVARTDEERQEETAQVEANRLQEIVRLAGEISNEPLAHIMYGAKELFHSNILAWFGKSMYTAASQVFDSLDPDPVDSDMLGRRHIRLVEREKQNLDLVVHWDDHRWPMIIENKVFSLPDTEQLEKYTKVIAKDPALQGGRQVLLSLQDPGWDEDTYDTADRVPGGGSWHRVSYGQLSTEILKVVPESDTSYEAETMRRYARLVGNLQEIADLVQVHSDGEKLALPSGLLNVLADRKLFDALSKFRARNVAQLVKQQLAASGLTAEVGSDFSHSAVSIAAFHSLDIPDAPDGKFGWQIQDGQFRLFAVLTHLSGKTPADEQARVAWANEHLEYFDFTMVDEVLATAGDSVKPLVKASVPSGFGKYNPDFIYRYKSVPSLSISQLIEVAKTIARGPRPSA